MLDSTGYPKLIDMGYAKVLTSKSAYKTFTFCGTPRFLAPESVVSEGSGFAVDHWALGILIYEMLVGESPFYWEGIDEPSLFASIAQVEYPAPPSTLSTKSAQLIAGLLVKDPSKRFGSNNNGRDHVATDAIAKHAWFRDFDLSALQRKEITAPWIPTIDNVLDAGCFDDWSDELEDRVTQHYPKLTHKEAAVFNSF